MDFSTYDFMVKQFTSINLNFQSLSERLERLEKQQLQLIALLDGQRSLGGGDKLDPRRPNVTVMIVPQTAIERYVGGKNVDESEMDDNDE
jgi:hypothetical protein